MGAHQTKAFFAHLLLGGITLGLLGGIIAPAEAKWFKTKQDKVNDALSKQVQTFQAPATDALSMYCEPYRKEAAELSHANPLIKPFVGPRRSWLIRQHEKCKHEYMSQEMNYLKHVDVQQAPSLPRLSTPAGGEEQGPKPEEARPLKSKNHKIEPEKTGAASGD